MAKFVSVIISGNAKPLKKALDDSTANMTDFQKKVATGFIVAGAAATAFATSAVKAAAKDQVAMKNLERQLRASAGANAEQVHQAEKYLKTAGRASAFGKTALIPGFMSLVTATQDVTKAQNIMNVALDTARARNLDVTTVSEALAKAYAGNTRGLRNLSPEMKKLIADGATFGDVLKKLGKNFGGAASEYAATFQGRLQVLNNTTAALKKQIGYALLPIVERMIPVFQSVADAMVKHPKIVTAIAYAVGTLAVAFMTATAAVIAWKVASQVAAMANMALGTSFTALNVATGGIMLAVGAAAVAIMKWKGNTDSATKATEEFSDALFKAGKGQREAIANLVSQNPAFAKTTTFMAKLGYSADDLANYLATGTGEMTNFYGALYYASKEGANNAYSMNLLNEAQRKVFRTTKLTKGEFDSMIKVLDQLMKGTIDYKKAQETLNMLGLGDESEKAAQAEERRAKALKKATDTLAGARKAVRDYANSIKESILGMVSLSSAFGDAQSKQDEATNNLNEALKDRADAYAKLNALESDRYANAKDLANAQLAVADAENKVTQARQVTAPNYTELFKKQIEDAKKFAGFLKQLRQMNLSDTAVQQLLALGPIAGAQVAQDLISGANGMTVGTLNADLATVGDLGYQAGIAGPGEAGILSGTKVGGSGGTYQIYVTSADPKAVVDALKTYMRQNGAVPIKVTGK